jgi:hypothetical protein
MLASIFTENMRDMIPVFAIFGTFLTCIVFFLLAHQRRMAQILRGHQQDQPAVTADPQLRDEIAALREMVAHQSIAIDNRASEQARMAKVLQTDEALREQLQPRH